MAANIKGIIVEIGGDTSGLQKALKKVNSSTSSLSKELRGINSLLKFDPKNTELLSQKQTVLNEKIESTEEKLKVLKEAQEEADKAMKNGTKISAENYRNLQREIINTENQLKQMKVEASKWTSSGAYLKELGAEVDGIGNKIGKFGSNVTKIATATATAVATIAITSMDAVDEGLDTVAKKTGATGDAAKELQEVYRQVAAEVPAEFGDIGAAVGEINTRLGFTGEKLKQASVQFLKFAKVNDADVNSSVQLVTRAMGDAGIAADNYAEVLDMLTVAGQKSGISIDSLATNLAKYGAPMRALGIDTKNAIAMFAGWEKAGVNTEIAFSGMKKAISNWGAAGKDATKEFSKTLEEIKKCPNIAKATTKAIEVFGAKAGPDLADAIRGGRFEFEEYVKALEGGSGTLNNTYGQIVDEVDDAQLAMQNIQLAFHDTGEVIMKTLSPTLLDLAEDFKNLMNRFDKLDPALKKNIVKWTTLSLTLGPLIKTGGSLVSLTGKSISALGNLSSTVGQVKSGMSVANNATGLLAKGIAGLTTPAGLATATITATAAAITYLALKQSEAQKKAKELAKEMKNAKEEMDEYQASVDKTAEANISQVNSIIPLKNELKNLVEENGKVKEGYENRVAFILNELNKALGTEYALNGNIVDSYKELQGEIDTTIEKKKAQILLQADEEKLADAVKNQAAAVDNLKKSYQELGMPIEEAKNKIKMLKEEMSDSLKYNLEHNAEESLANSREIERLENLVSAIENTENRVKTYTENANRYADKYQMYQEGKYKEIGNIVTGATENWCNKSLNEIKNNIVEQGKALETYELIYRNTGNTVAQQQIQQAEANLTNLANELVRRTQTLNELGPSEVAAWKKLADDAYGQYSAAVSQMAPEMQRKIQETTGVIAAGAPEMQTKAKEAAEKTITEFDKNADARQKALNTIEGYLNGLNDKEKRQMLKDIGIQDVDLVLNELNRGDLSEESGKSILEGVYKGLGNNSWTDKILSTAANLANSITKTLSGGKISFSSIPGHKAGLEYVPYDNYVARLHKGERVLTAKENKELMNLDKIKRSGNIDFSKFRSNVSNRHVNVTVQFYPQHMTDTEIDRAFDYINKKYSKYYL